MKYLWCHETQYIKSHDCMHDPRKLSGNSINDNICSNKSYTYRYYIVLLILSPCPFTLSCSSELKRWDILQLVASRNSFIWNLIRKHEEDTRSFKHKTKPMERLSPHLPAFRVTYCIFHSYILHIPQLHIAYSTQRSKSEV